MFKIGDRVKQQDTGNIGIVVGYGHRIVNNKCLTTIRVKLERSTSIKETMVIVTNHRSIEHRSTEH